MKLFLHKFFEVIFSENVIFRQKYNFSFSFFYHHDDDSMKIFSQSFYCDFLSIPMLYLSLSLFLSLSLSLPLFLSLSLSVSLSHCLSLFIFHSSLLPPLSLSLSPPLFLLSLSHRADLEAKRLCVKCLQLALHLQVRYN